MNIQFMNSSHNPESVTTLYVLICKPTKSNSLYKM